MFPPTLPPITTRNEPVRTPRCRTLVSLLSSRRLPNLATTPCLMQFPFLLSSYKGYVPKLDFLVVSVFHFGVDQESFWRDKDQFNPPSTFEDRIDVRILSIFLSPAINRILELTFTTFHANRKSLSLWLITLRTSSPPRSSTQPHQSLARS
jgi:hypothetical protein